MFKYALSVLKASILMALGAFHALKLLKVGGVQT